ncbi:hypothetical protein E2C01_031052 [Portunus trituberculatus]|uniref:Uncharacterized protein n=1 Tax=Portunus trituberculatus TaxID=210409 RepID=A0A5B7EWK9_PORTR|nr:hypothetical protein [Portunus trituberculatus]
MKVTPVFNLGSGNVLDTSTKFLILIATLSSNSGPAHVHPPTPRQGTLTQPPVHKNRRKEKEKREKKKVKDEEKEKEEEDTEEG